MERPKTGRARLGAQRASRPADSSRVSRAFPTTIRQASTGQIGARFVRPNVWKAFVPARPTVAELPCQYNAHKSAWHARRWTIGPIHRLLRLPHRHSRPQQGARRRTGMDASRMPTSARARRSLGRHEGQKTRLIFGIGRASNGMIQRCIDIVARNIFKTPLHAQHNPLKRFWPVCARCPSGALAALVQLPSSPKRLAIRSS